jgi:hypothetical protein
MEQFCNTADSGSALLGSHSIGNYAATQARKCGCNKDEKDIRGRWKSKGQVSDVYNDVELPYPDTKVAEKLSIGGVLFLHVSLQRCKCQWWCDRCNNWEQHGNAEDICSDSSCAKATSGVMYPNCVLWYLERLSSFGFLIVMMLFLTTFYPKNSRAESNWI